MQDNSTPDIPLKQCSKCKEWFPETTEYFHRRAASPGGLRKVCKTCVSRLYSTGPRVDEYQKSYRKANRHELKERKKLEYERNKATYREYAQSYRVEKKDELKEKKKEYHQNRYQNDDTYRKDRLEKDKKWRETNPDYFKKYHLKNADKAIRRMREWVIANPEQAKVLRRITMARRRARLRSSEGNHTAEDVKRIYKSQRGKCYYCGCKVGDKYHVDHVIPLSRGGSNGPENIAVTCPHCNLSKHDKLPTEWDGSNRLL